MIRVLAIQHSYPEFLGALESLLEARSIGFTYQRPVAGQDLAAGALHFDALFLLGGEGRCDDAGRHPWLPDEERLVRAFLRAQRPVVGFGFGGLLLARLCGGRVLADAAGVARVVTARALREDDALAAALAGRELIALADGDVELPASAVPVLGDESGRWLAARVASAAYALKLRPELRPGMIEDMIMEEGRSLPAEIGGLLEAARTRWPQIEAAAAPAVAGLVAALDLMRERPKPRVIAIRPAAGGGA